MKRTSTGGTKRRNIGTVRRKSGSSPVFLTEATTATASASTQKPPPSPRMQPLDVDMTTAVSPLRLDCQQDSLTSLVVDSASAWMPFVLRFLSFRGICRVAATCKVWRSLVQSCDPSIVVPHLEVSIRRHLFENGRNASTPTNSGSDEDVALRAEARKLAINVCLATGGNSALLIQMRTVHELERKCRTRPHGSAYSTFLRRIVPVARCYSLLCEFVPALFRNLANSIHWIDLSCCWQPGIDICDVSRFSLALACTLGALSSETDLRSSVCPVDRKPLRLRVEYSKQSEFGLFMNPLNNTVHCASLDIAFLCEQLRNSCKSLSRFDEICGYCADLPTLEARVSQLLGLRGVQRDPDLSESSHAHCLFKLALYNGEIDGGLRGTIIRPSKAFESAPSPDGLVVAFLWCASWMGRNGRASSGSTSSNASDAHRDPNTGTPADADDSDDETDGSDSDSTIAEGNADTDND